MTQDGNTTPTPEGKTPKAESFWSKQRRRIALLNQRYPRGKYIVVIALFVAYTLLMGRFSISDYWSIKERETYLRQEIETLAPQLSADSLRLKQLRDQGADQVEYVAREQHLMKSPGEDIYVINEEVAH